jgi:hypothetical protein
MMEYVWYNPSSNEMLIAEDITHLLWIYFTELTDNPAGSIYLGVL